MYYTIILYYYTYSVTRWDRHLHENIKSIPVRYFQVSPSKNKMAGFSFYWIPPKQKSEYQNNKKKFGETSKLFDFLGGWLLSTILFLMDSFQKLTSSSEMVHKLVPPKDI